MTNCDRPALFALRPTGQRLCRMHSRTLDASARAMLQPVRSRGALCDVQVVDTYPQHWRQLKRRVATVHRMLRALPTIGSPANEYERGWDDALARHARMAFHHARVLRDGPSSWLNVDGQVIPAWLDYSTDTGASVGFKDKTVACPACDEPLIGAMVVSEDRETALRCRICEREYPLIEESILAHYMAKEKQP